MTRSTERVRVAIVGGGCAALTTAFELSRPEHNGRYEVTVYQGGAPPASTCLFKHALIQDAAYESLLRKTRQEFHGKIGAVLDATRP
ncbi:MAG: hypothetical protein ABMA15_13755 [Vicinamibacterales bacterium]